MPDLRRRFTNLAATADGEFDDLDGPAKLASERAQAARCDQLRKQLSDRLGRRYAADVVALDAFQVYHAAQKKTVARLQSMRPKLPGLVRSGSGLIFFGSVGTGKDHLMAAMLYACCEAGIHCDWVNGQTLFQRFRDGMSGDDRESSIVQSFFAPQVLAISDPTPPVPLKDESWRLETLYRVIDKRYRDMKSTWLTINAVDANDADAKLSAQVFDRLRDGAEMIPCFWPSFRERAK